MLLFVPDHLWTQEMCIEIMRTMPDAFHCIRDHFKTQEICDKHQKKTLLPCSLFLIGLLKRSGCGCGVMTIMMMMVVIGMLIMMKINKKHKVHKGLIKEELLPIAWHSSRW